MSGRRSRSPPVAYEDSLVFERLHEQAYRDLGFQLIKVPAGPLTDRVASVEHTVERLESDRTQTS